MKIITDVSIQDAGLHFNLRRLHLKLVYVQLRVFLSCASCEEKSGTLRGQQRKARCPQPQPDRGCSRLTCLLPPRPVTDTISSPAQPITADKSKDLVHLRTSLGFQFGKIKSNQFQQQWLLTEEVFLKGGPSEALHRLGCGREDDTL